MANKYGIVTGASRGLGKACAEELAREGFDVIITYEHNADKALEVKAEYEKEFGVRIEAYKLSQQSEAEVIEFRKWAEQNFGTNLQVLINNAGVYSSQPTEEFVVADFDRLIDVNVKGVFYMVRHFVDLMIANHFGKIINMCSAAGLRAAPGSCGYSASKFAVRGMTQAQAIDLGKYNIQVNAIAPGSHKTDMFFGFQKANPKLCEERTKGNPLQRVGEVTEMCHLVKYFLASDFITGQVVSPNGGTTMV